MRQRFPANREGEHGAGQMRCVFFYRDSLLDHLVSPNICDNKQGFAKYL